jgi:hypothetical protein
MTSLGRPRVLWFSVVMILALASASMAQGTGTTLASAPRQAQIGVKFVW